MEDKYTGFLKGRRELYANRDKFPMDGDIPSCNSLIPYTDVTPKGAEITWKPMMIFLDWAYDAKVVEEAEYNNLCFESYCYFPEAENVFEKVIDARNCINDLVVSLAEGVAPYPGTITNFNTHFEEVKKAHCFEYERLRDAGSLDRHERSARLPAMAADKKCAKIS